MNGPSQPCLLRGVPREDLIKRWSLERERRVLNTVKKTGNFATHVLLKAANAGAAEAGVQWVQGVLMFASFVF
jgi:hypothetical protein